MNTRNTNQPSSDDIPEDRQIISGVVDIIDGAGKVDCEALESRWNETDILPEDFKCYSRGSGWKLGVNSSLMVLVAAAICAVL